MKTVNTRKNLDSDDTDAPSVRECPDSHSQPLNDMDFKELEQQYDHNRTCG